MSTPNITTDLPPNTKWENGRMEQTARELPASAQAKPFQVHVIDKRTGREVWNGRVRADALKSAEEAAVSKASFETRGDPQKLEARHVHELCPLCGSMRRGGAQ